MDLMIHCICKKNFRVYSSSRNNFTPLCLYCSFAVIDSAHIDVINKKPLLLKKLPYIFLLLLLLHITKLQHSCLSFILLSKKKNNIIQCVLINVASFDTLSEIFFSCLVFFFFSLLQNGARNFIKMH